MTVDDFIARWTGREGGAERANYQMFLAELCDVLGVPRPDPAGATTADNDYVFERAVKQRESEATAAPSTLRIDLYRRGASILEAKQSRLPGQGKALPGQTALPGMDIAQPEERSTGAKWDALMRRARQQAEDYAADAAELARGFKRGGKRIEQRIVQVLETLAKYGRVVALPNGTYAARRAA